ncbi:hypothetical protein FKP32DRAFT_1148440 [Trametes sanguinea]|nr:hypothetical protein FKP32DRAFT_1148440 [Trametes sanguinea]
MSTSVSRDDTSWQITTPAAAGASSARASRVAPRRRQTRRSLSGISLSRTSVNGVGAFRTIPYTDRHLGALHAFLRARLTDANGVRTAFAGRLLRDFARGRVWCPFLQGLADASSFTLPPASFISLSTSRPPFPSSQRARPLRVKTPINGLQVGRMSRETGLVGTASERVRMTGRTRDAVTLLGYPEGRGGPRSLSGGSCSADLCWLRRLHDSIVGPRARAGRFPAR